MTLAELAITIALLGALGLVASRVGLSAIPAYLLAGILLGPNEPKLVSLVQPSEVTDFVAEIGLVFLLFFLGLEFSLDRLVRSGRHVARRRRRSRRQRGARRCSSALLRSGPAWPRWRRGRRLRLVERDRRQGARRLPASRRRRDRPRARHPAVRGRRRGRAARLRRRGRRRADGLGGRRGRGAGIRRRLARRRALPRRARSAACSRASTSSSSSSPCSAS